MEINFYKLQTAGNDLILSDFSGKRFPEKSELCEISRRICRRDYGIGGNGFIALKSRDDDDFSALFIDPYGVVPDVTVDAAFCLSRYIFDSASAGNRDFTLNINGHKQNIGLIDSSNFRISLGIPLTDEKHDFIEDPDADSIVHIKAGRKEYPATRLFLQKEGLVLFSGNRNIAQLKEISDEILGSGHCGKDCRLIFAKVNGREELEVHIRNSRGDDYATSCAMAAAASTAVGFLDREAVIYHKLGKYYFQWVHPSNEIFVTGSADYLFTGSYFLDE